MVFQTEPNFGDAETLKQGTDSSVKLVIAYTAWSDGGRRDYSLLAATQVNGATFAIGQINLGQRIQNKQVMLRLAKEKAQKLSLHLDKDLWKRREQVVGEWMTSGLLERRT